MNTLVTKDYKLIITENHLGLLVLFPCFPCDAENTKAEFNIVDIAMKNGISLLLMNFNQHFYTLDSENNELADILSKAIVDNKFGRDNIYIGGFSSGGNVALLLSNYLIKTNNDIFTKILTIVYINIFYSDNLIFLSKTVNTKHKNYK